MMGLQASEDEALVPSTQVVGEPTQHNHNHNHNHNADVAQYHNSKQVAPPPRTSQQTEPPSEHHRKSVLNSRISDLTMEQLTDVQDLLVADYYLPSNLTSGMCAVHCLIHHHLMHCYTTEPVHQAMKRWFPTCSYSLLPQEPEEPPVAVEVRPVLHVFQRAPKWVSMSWTHCDTRQHAITPEPLAPTDLVLGSIWLSYLSCTPDTSTLPPQEVTADFEWSFCMPQPSARNGKNRRPWSVTYCREAQYTEALQKCKCPPKPRQECWSIL
jgi:hypothetical protein